MTDALTQALANAAANAPKGEELHLENLESIANPESSPKLLDVIEQFTPSIDYIRESMAVPEFKTSQSETVRLKRSHFSNFASPDYTDISYISIDSKLNQVIDKSNSTNLRLDALADMISEVSTTISKAAQSMPSTPDHKHRSLHEWDDSTLLNELVERENDLMPFYYELLKRIGSPELQSLVMSSMQGKNASMVTLAQLCSALAPTPQQSRPVYEAGISPSAEQRMDEAFHAATTPQTYTQAQLDNLRFNGQSSGITVEEIALYEKMKRSSSPSYPATIPSMPPTYNPFFKEQ